jgi:transposase
MGSRRLTLDMRDLIRKRLGQGVRPTEIAARLGISVASVYNVRKPPSVSKRPRHSKRLDATKLGALLARQAERIADAQDHELHKLLIDLARLSLAAYRKAYGTLATEALLQKLTEGMRE